MEIARGTVLEIFARRKRREVLDEFIETRKELEDVLDERIEVLEESSDDLDELPSSRGSFFGDRKLQ